MKLWTKELEKITPKLYETEDIEFEDKIVTAKFFALGTGINWYVVEAERREDGDVLFFGYVENEPFSEWGYFSLNELKEVKTPYGIPAIERDLYFRPKPFKEILRG